MVPPIVFGPTSVTTYPVDAHKKEKPYSEGPSFPKMAKPGATTPPILPKSIPVRTQSQQALMILLDLSSASIDELSKTCGFGEKDSINDLFKKILSNRKTSTTLQKAKKAIQQYNNYLTFVGTLKTQIALGSNRIITDNINKLIGNAFLKTMFLLKDEKMFKEYISILRKHNIHNPLQATRSQLDKMTLYEETAFEAATNSVRAYALSNLSLNGIKRYLAYQEQIKTAITENIKSHLKQNKPEYLEFFGREKLAATILATPSKKRPPVALVGLASKEKKLIEKYQAALNGLKQALSTPDQNDEKTARAKLEQIKKEVADEVGRSYKNAFVDTPSKPEKAAFKALLKTTVELEIIDEKIIYYARLGKDSLTASDRNLIDYLKKTGNFSKKQVDPLAFKKMSLFQWIDNYKSEHVHFALLRYAQLVEEDIQISSDPEKNRIGLHKNNRVNAFFFALQAAGFSFKELNMIGALVAFGKLTTVEKSELPKIRTELIKKCLGEIKKSSEQQESESFSRLDNAARRESIRKNILFYYLLSGLTGSSINADYLLKTQAQNQKTGVLPEVELEYSEATPEKHDDRLAQQYITDFFAFGAEQFGLNIWNIIGNHIYIRKTLGKEPDNDFINKALSFSSFAGTLSANGQYGLEGFKKEFVFCLTYKTLESNLRTKPNLERSKASLLQIASRFIGEIGKKLKKDPKCAGSDDISNRIGLLGNIYKLLLESQLLTEKELDQFALDNPIIPPSSGIKITDLNGSQIHRTTGYDGVPKEVQSIIKAAGFEGFCRQNSHLLNVYWVPRDKKAAFAGYATYDKNTVVVTYDKINPGQISELGGILMHELRHKKDMEELRQYIKQNPKFREKMSAPPSLITERNAYICKHLFYKNSGTLNSKMAAASIRSIYVSNLLLGLPEDDMSILSPPYNRTNLQSSSLDLHPGTLMVTQKEIKLLLKVLDYLGYSKQEKGILLIAGIRLFANHPTDLLNYPTDRRDLLIDLVGKLIGNKKTKTNGFNNQFIMNVVMNAKKQYKQDSSSLSSISVYQFLGYLKYFCKKNKIRLN